MLIDPTWEPRALEAHASLPPGEIVPLPASRVDEDEIVSVDNERAKRSNDRMAAHARKLGLSQAEYRRRRAAGTLPGWCYARAPRFRRAG